MSETKSCKACAEDIRAAAKVCPHCRQSQRLLNSRSPLVAIFFSVILLFAILTLMMPNRMEFKPGVKFQDHAGEIVVRESSFAFGDCGACKGSLQISTVGMLDNTGEESWKELQFEVQYYDEAGELIDAVSSTEYSLVLPAGGEAAFRVKAAAARPSELYASHRVIVTNAKDLDAWP